MTELLNSDINRFDEKLKIYNGKFFDVIKAEGGLLGETISIKESVDLGMKTGVSTASTTVYSTDQFSKFIKKVVNFKIKNYDDLDSLGLDLSFVNKDNTSYTSHINQKEHIIGTLKTINVFVDILEAYKNCIESADTIAVSGYSLEHDIAEIQLVNDKTRFYSTQNAVANTILPSADKRNVGYIRKVANRNILFLSIQSFDTGMILDKHNYEKFFTKSGTATLAANTNILDAEAMSTSSHNTQSIAVNYKHQDYTESTVVGALTGLTLEERNKKLIVLLLKTLFGLNKVFRKQSVLALYYYYKFVQLYSAFIINVSNVMYNDVKKTSATEPSPLRIDTYNMTTYKTNHGISALEYTKSNTDKDITTTLDANHGITSIAVVGVTPAATTLATISITSNRVTIARGLGYKVNPGLTVLPATITAKATIVPMVFETTTMGNDDNIERLQTVITEINNTITTLLNEFTIDESTSLVISTVSQDSPDETSVYMNASNEVVIWVKKQNMRTKILGFKRSYDLENDFVIYDKISKIIYDIKSIVEDANVEKITINAVFHDKDKIEGNNTKIFTSHLGEVVNKPVDTNTASSYKITHTSDFLLLQKKDMLSYKDTYITTREEISVLDENIGFMTNRVFHQNNLYETHNTKKIFIERQVLAYNIILAIIILILVGINVVKVDKQIMKTVSLSCLGVIILLFVIYFISNMTYIETFALDANSDLHVLRYNAFTANTSPHGSNNDGATYKNKKLTKLRSVITALNTRFISYFEKVTIMLPASDNFDFYKEISEVVRNDKENKDYTNKTLGYSKNQNDNNINSLKYELENNKLYLNTILISAIIFVGLYNMYINYLTDDKYLLLMIFVCMIIFIIIISYYYITANRRVKTVFKSIYWGPEFSKGF